MQYYKAFGLAISSEMELPELPRGDGTIPVEATIRYGKTPETLDNVTERGILYEANNTQFLLHLDDIGRYYVEDGRTITIERDNDVDDGSVRVFLLGSAMGALLHQRGLLPLHGSAIKAGDGAVLFSGVSGAGKSTTAAAFVRRGYRLLADDVCAIEVNDSGQPIVRPGYPQHKLWADMLEKFETDANKLTRVRPQLNKFAVPAHDSFCDTTLPLKATYVLVSGSNSEEPELTPLDGIWRLRALKFQVYRQRFMEKRGATINHAKQFAALANHVRVCRVTRPDYPFMLDELVNLIEKDIEEWAISSG